MIILTCVKTISIPALLAGIIFWGNLASVTITYHLSKEQSILCSNTTQHLLLNKK